jgi:ASC-1-like (ASCH) protein
MGLFMIHELKIHPQYYCRVADGSKTFEVRNNDRGFQPGDTVILKEWDPEPVNSTGITPKGFTESKPLKFKIGYILVLDSNRVVFSLLPFKK